MQLKELNMNTATKALYYYSQDKKKGKVWAKEGNLITLEHLINTYIKDVSSISILIRSPLIIFNDGSLIIMKKSAENKHYLQVQDILA